MSPPTKTLVRAPQWLGDAVVSTLFISRLKERHPGSSLAVAAPAYLRDLYAAHPAVSEFIPLSSNVRESAVRLQAVGAQTIYLLPRSFRTALEAWLAKIPRRIGFPGDFRRPLLTESIRYEAALPYPNRYLKLIGDENVSLRGQAPFFPQADLTAEAATKKFGIDWTQIKAPILGIGPVSIAPSRTWLPDRFAEVAKRHVASTGGGVLLFGSEREAPVTRVIQQAIGKAALDTAGKLSLPELGWFVSRCQKFICNDSGLMHVASAFHIPTVVVFGASDPTYALPQTGRFISLQRTDIDCVPCLRNTCVRFGDMHLACLKGISSNDATMSLNQVLTEGRDA